MAPSTRATLINGTERPKGVLPKETEVFAWPKDPPAVALVGECLATTATGFRTGRFFFFLGLGMKSAAVSHHVLFNHFKGRRILSAKHRYLADFHCDNNISKPY